MHFPHGNCLAETFSDAKNVVKKVVMRKNVQLMKEKNLLIIIMFSNDSSSVLPSI